VALAKSQHRPELAKQIENEGTKRIEILQNFDARYRQDNSAEQNKYRNIAYSAAWYSSVILLLSLLGTIVLLILTTAGKYFLGRNVNCTKPSLGKIIYGAFFSGGVVATITTLILFVIIALIKNASVAVSSIMANVFLIIILLFFLFILAVNVTRLIHSERGDNRGFWISVIRISVSIGMIALIAATWPYIIMWINSRFMPDLFVTNNYNTGNATLSFIQNLYQYLDLLEGASAGYFWRIVIAMTPFVFGGLFLIAQILKKQKQLTNPEILAVTLRLRVRNLVKWLLKLIFQMALLGFWGLAILMAIGQFTQLQLTWLEIFVFLIVLLLITCWFWWHKPHRRASASFGLHLFSRSLKWWMCLASIGILATMIIQLSVSKPMLREVNSQLYGDMSSFQQVRH
jgi:hypothetical protein